MVGRADRWRAVDGRRRRRGRASARGSYASDGRLRRGSGGRTGRAKHLKERWEEGTGSQSSPESGTNVSW
jgi:hypothetical protein